MYLKKTENYILDYLKSQYKKDDLNKIQKSGMLIQKSPEGINSDFGTSIPLRLAKIVNKNPMDIANHISAELDKSKPEFISKIEPLKVQKTVLNSMKSHWIVIPFRSYIYNST